MTEPLKISDDELDGLARYGLALTQMPDGTSLAFDRNASEDDMVDLFRLLFPQAAQWLQSQIGDDQNEWEPLRKHYKSWTLPNNDAIQTGEWFYKLLPKGHESSGKIVLSK